MDLRLYRRLLRRRWIAILLLTMLGAAAGAALAWTQSPTYEAKVGMYVATTNPGSDPAQAYEGALLAQQQAGSYAALLTDDHVLRSLIGSLGLPYSVDTLKKEVSASNTPNTAAIHVTVKDPSAQRASAIAHAYGPVFSAFVATIGTSGPSGVPTASGPSSGLKVITLQPTALKPERVAPHRGVTIVLGTVAGLVLGMGWAVIREVTDTRIRDAEDAARASGVRVLGAPSGVTNDLGALLLANGQLRLSTVEAYRRLSVNLQLLSSGRAPLTLVMTGPRGSEGTIITATDLAITFAERGDRVVLVDADLGQTRPGGLLGLPPVPGFRDVLAGSVPLTEALRVWRVGLPLLVLPNGTSPSGPFDMVREQDVATLRDELTDRADIVIFVAPPLLTKPDAVLLARVAGSALVVARTKATRSRELSESVGYLQSAGVEVLGVVLKGTAGRSNWAPNGLVSSGPDQAGDLTEDMAGSGPLSSRPAAA